MYDHVFRQKFSISYWKKDPGRYTVYQSTDHGRVVLGEIIRVSSNEWFFFPVTRENGEFYFGLTRSESVNACMNFY